MLRSVLGGLFATVVLLGRGASAPAQPAVDRTDPVAVATAYVQACRDGDLDTALSLLGPDERVRDELRDFAESFVEEDGPGATGMTLGDFVLELQFVPLPFAMDRTFVSSKADGGHAQVAFRANWPAEQQIVLTRGEDGNWSVDLLQSLKATNPQGMSWIAEEMDLDDPEAEPPVAVEGMEPNARAAMAEGAFDAYQAFEVLGRLVEGLWEYARDHDGRLPPAATWVDELELYLLDRSAFRDPGAPDLAYGFAMNPAAGGWKLFNEGEDIEAAEEFLILFEWPEGERNATATPEQLAQTRSFWPDGSVAFFSSSGETGVLPKGMTLQQMRAAWAPGGPGEAAVDWAEMHEYVCSTNLEVLAQAARRYAREHGGLLPSAQSWQDDLAPYVLLARDENAWEEGVGDEPEPFHCPAAPDLAFGYAINAAIAGKNALDLTDQNTLVLFFESDLNVPNAAGDPQRDGCDPPRHRNPDAVGGHNRLAYLTGGTGWQALGPKAPEGFAPE